MKSKWQSLEVELLEALIRIAGHEYRADRRRAGMVDVLEIQQLQKIARNAIKKANEQA